MKIDLFFIALVAYANAQFDDGERIVGGSDFERNFNYQVSVQINGSHVCGGGLINERFVLTTASCVRLYNPTSIAAGSNRLSATTHFAIINTFIHPRFNSFINDIALIQTRDRITASPTLNTGFLKLPEEDVGDLKRVITSGWGLKANGSSPNSLNSLVTQTISQRECRIRFNITTIPSEIFCTFSDLPNRGACSLDEGNPVVIRNIVYGITTKLYSCGNGRPDVHTRVRNYVAWIANTVNENIYK